MVVSGASGGGGGRSEGGSTLLEAPGKGMTLCKIYLALPFCCTLEGAGKSFQDFIIVLEILKQVCKV